MLGLQKRYVLALTFVAAYGVVRVTGQQTTAAGPYTAAQATAGRAVYQASCASCHNADLSGLNAPALAGLQFTGSWGERTTADLVAFMQGAMPPDNPGSLGEAAYLNVAAFILDTNGARAGNQPLTAATRVAIRTVATGQVRTVAQAGGRGGQAGAQAGRAGRGGGPRRTASRAARTTGARRSEELHQHHRRHAAQSRSQRLDHDPARLSRQQLQHLEPDHHGQREGSATAMGVGHERRDQSAGAGGSQRDPVHE